MRSNKAFKKIIPFNPKSMGKLTQKQVHTYLKWLAPGLLIKRWMFLSLAGVLLTILGLAIWVNLTPIYRLIEITSILISNVAKFFPSYISGPLAIAIGLLFIFWGQSRTITTISDVFSPDRESALVDLLRDHSRSNRLNQGVRIVTIGGGTGLSTLLRGLKHISSNITAVVTVADDGGSSGRLRREIGVLPPGDIRNCIAALADEEKLLTELFQYRFMAGNGLTGHSFGNLFLTAMTEITGDLERAIAASSKVLAIEGRVLPATLSDVHLWAEMDDGRRVNGESHISEDGGKIKTIGCLPSDPPALPAVLSAIDQAEMIIMGPGSLYTSVIPNLLVPEIREAILARQVPTIYVCNIMTQPGETDGYSVADHIAAIDQACGQQQLFDAVLVNEHTPSAQALIRYSKEKSHPVYIDREHIRELKRRVVMADIMHEDENTGFVRHDHHKLSKALINWYYKSHHLID